MHPPQQSLLQVDHDLFHTILIMVILTLLCFIIKVIRLHPIRKAHLEQRFSDPLNYLGAKSETKTGIVRMCPKLVHFDPELEYFLKIYLQDGAGGSGADTTLKRNSAMLAEFLLTVVAVISLKCTVYSIPVLFESCELLYSVQ